MDGLEVGKQIPAPIVALASVVVLGFAAILAMTSTAVASSEIMFLEWTLSAALVGALAALSSKNFTNRLAVKAFFGAGAALAYWLARIAVELWSGLP